MKKILFPTDFSACAKNAFSYTLELAKKLDAKIDLISIYNLPVSDASSVPPEFIQEMLDEKKAAVESQLDAFCSEFGNPPQIGDCIAEYGVFVYQEVTDKAQEEAYHLIAMGTKGEHNAVEKLMGSVTSHMIMHADCPVLAIPEYAEYQSVGKLAFATDFMPEQGEAVQQLLDLAKELNAKVEFVHVNTKQEEEEWTGEASESARKEGFTSFTMVHHKSAVHGIEEYLEQNAVEILAIFIPKRKLWERLFHSSFSRKMAFHSKIPLLTFR